MTDVTLKRFLKKIRIHESGCWEWTAATNSRGYGVFNIANVKFYAHRLAYQHWVGEIPDDLEIDHLCRNRWCVNPDHLRVVTHELNRQPKMGIVIG